MWRAFRRRSSTRGRVWPWIAARHCGYSAGGWAPESAQPFDFIEDPEAHLSDRQRELTWSIDWQAAQLLDDKLAFFFMLRHLQIPTPHVSGVIIRGRVHEFRSEHAHWGPGWVRERLDNRGRLRSSVQLVGAEAGDLLILESRGGEYALNGRVIGWASIEDRLHELEDHLISDYVSQAAYARELFPATTNTLRVITMLSPTDGPFMAGAQQRIGTPQSVPTDNTGMGGIFCDVDLSDGTLEPALEAHSPDHLIRHDRHPATGARLAGVQIPNWGTCAPRPARGCGEDAVPAVHRLGRHRDRRRVPDRGGQQVPGPPRRHPARSPRSNLLDRARGAVQTLRRAGSQ